MKAVIIYRPNSEHGRLVDEFAHQFSRLHPDIHLELLNIDGREGSAMASLYDIVSYPAILALQDDGSANMVWEGDELPLIDEVAGYTRSTQ